MKHVFAIKIEGESLRVLPQRWDSAQDMRRDLPDGEYLLGATFTMDAAQRAAEQFQQQEDSEESLYELQQRKIKADKRAQLLQRQEALKREMDALD